MVEPKDEETLFGLIPAKNNREKQLLKKSKDEKEGNSSTEDIKKKIIKACCENNGYIPSSLHKRLNVNLRRFNEVLWLMLDEELEYDEQAKQWRLKDFEKVAERELLGKLNKESTADEIIPILETIKDKPPLRRKEILVEISKRTKFGLGDLRKQLKDMDKKQEIGEEPKEITLDKDTEEEAEKLLRDPALLANVNKILEYEMTGDEENRLFYFIVNEARKYTTQLVRPQGQTTAGKNWEIKWVKMVVPNTYEFASSTASHFIRKIKDGEIKTKGAVIIHTEDRRDSGKFAFNIDQLYGEEKIIVGFSVKENGDWKPVDVEIEGPLVFYTTSTEKADEHRKARTWITNPDESLEQNERISRWKKWRKSLPQEELDKHESDMRVLRCALLKLKRYERIVLPYWDFIFFQHRETDDRRKEDNFELLVRMIAHIHQKQRPRDEENSILVSLPQDLFIAWEISKNILGLARTQPTKRQERMLEILRKAGVGERDENGMKERIITTTGGYERSVGGGDYFSIKDCLENENWEWEYQVTYNNLMDLLNKGKLIGHRKGREWLFALKDEDPNVLSPFIKINRAIFGKKNIIEGLKRIFYNSSTVCEDIYNKIKELFTQRFLNPFFYEISYVYDGNFIKRQIKEGERFFRLDRYEDLLIKRDKISEVIKEGETPFKSDLDDVAPEIEGGSD